MSTVQAVTRPQAEPDSVARRNSEGHGRRLTAAFYAMDTYPALAESRSRVLRLFSDERSSPTDLIAAVESDVALSIAALHMANRIDGNDQGQVSTVVQALDVLPPDSVRTLASRVPTFDFFERGGTWDGTPERFRLHALATQRAADRLAAAVKYAHRDRLLVTALLHDVGKLVLLHAYPGYPDQIHGTARTPEERIRQERRELGIDHALVGGVLARRWGLPSAIAMVIERHHSDDAPTEAMLVRLADMLGYYGQGGPISPRELLNAARAAGLGAADLRRVMYELPHPGQARQRAVDACPLSERELEVLQRLAQGKVYKQIATELALSTSTVRTHLHNTYGKLGAVDRAQAVLVATDRGWL